MRAYARRCWLGLVSVTDRRSTLRTTRLPRANLNYASGESSKERCSGGIPFGLVASVLNEEIPEQISYEDRRRRGVHHQVPGTTLSRSYY